MRRVFPALVLLALGAAAHAQSAQGSRFGVSTSAYFFTESRLRDVFGNPTITYGVNYGTLGRPRENRLALSYSVLTATRHDSTIFVLPVTLAYEKQFASARTAREVPYARLEAGYAYYDISLHDEGYDQGFKTGGAVGAAEAGIVFNRTLGVKARYNLFQDRFGVNLSGFQVGLTYNFGGF